jgi:predicted SnoaL-like aldol condensation-catalyzing enzyme
LPETFEKCKDGKIVEDWDEILKLLQPASSTVYSGKDPK